MNLAKTRFVLLPALFLAIAALASGAAKKPRVTHAIASAVTPPVRTMPKAVGQQPGAESHDTHFVFIHPKGFLPDPVVQRQFGSSAILPGPGAAITPGTSFDGVGVPNYGVLYIPPDTNGDVGGNTNYPYYVQIVNTAFGVLNKNTGTMVSGPTDIQSMFSGLTGTPCAATDDGDPIVKYDKVNDRWILSQFSVSNGSSQGYDECVAISQTPDPTGSWKAYDFSIGGTSYFNDYPKMGIWSDGYYFSYNLFNSAGTSYLGPEVCAVDSAQMVALSNSPTMVCFGAVQGNGPFSNTIDFTVLPADIDGANTPPPGSPEYLLDYTTNALRMFQFHVNWTTPASSTLTGPTAVANVAAFNDECNGGTCIPQPGTRHQLDTLGDRLMYRLAYRYFPSGSANTAGAYESLVVSHTVDNGSGIAGVRWWEIRSPGSAPTVYQQGTYSPDSTYRWMPSAAQDVSGDIAVGYSTSSSSIYPSIAYTGRLATDPLNTLPQGETTMYVGAGSQFSRNSADNRWGDYSSLSVDPTDDCTFWYTTEYYKTTGDFSWSTHVGSFSFPGCVRCNTQPPSGLTATPGTNQITLNWTASPTAGVTYDVYRWSGNSCSGTATLIASGVSAISYVDTTAAGGNTYSYEVSAVGGSPSCESSKTTCATATASSCSLSAPTGVTAAATADNQITVSWNAVAGATSYDILRGSGACPGSGYATIATSLSGSPFVDNTVTAGVTYSYEVVAVGSCSSAPSACASATATGTYSSSVVNTGTPVDTTTPVKWVFQTISSSLSPPGVSSGIFATSNDRYLHAMVSGTGTSGGDWPAGWTPFAMNAPVQARPTVISGTLVPGHSKVAYLASQDGHAYLVDANTGAEIAASPLLGDYLQGAVNGIFTAYGAAENLVFAGTRNSSSANSVYALDPATLNVVWQFDNGGGASGIGIIGGGAAVDYTNNRIYFASRSLSGGSSNTLWCLSLAGTPTTPLWAVNVGDVDGAVTFTGSHLYVGNNAGTVYSIDPSTGATLWSYATGDGPVKSFVAVDPAATPVVYFSTNGKVWALTDNGASSTLLAGWPVSSIASPSVPLYVRPLGKLFAGSSNGDLYQIDATTGAVSVPLTLAAGTRVGAATYDFGTGMVYVGNDAGDVYAVAVPLP